LSQAVHNAQLGRERVDTSMVVFPHLSFRVAEKHPMS
jgi:hypothetical protein